ncbi:UNVERIFIED_CONTAM: hypothetical protein FKN15_055569 [Acipenser sinensis]
MVVLVSHLVPRAAQDSNRDLPSLPLEDRSTPGLTDAQDCKAGYQSTIIQEQQSAHLCARESCCGEERKKDIALKPHERQEKKPSTLNKKQQDALPNGLSYHAWKNRHHGPSDQENDQNLGQHQRNKKKTHKRHKRFFGVLLWLICWLDLFYELGNSRVQHPVNIVTPLILGITMGVTDQLRFTTFYIYFGLLLFQLILSCFNEKPPLFSSIVTDPNPCPEYTAGFLSTMTFWWFTSMAIKGYRNPLEDKDLWSLNKKDTSEIVVPTLLKKWETEKAKVQRKNQAVYSTSSNKVLNHVDGETEEAGVLLLGKNDTKQPSFLKALLKSYGSYFLIGSAYKLMQDLICFVNPQLLNLLINFTMQKDAPSWWGFALAFLMFFCALLQTIILHQHFQYCFVTGMRLRTAIIGAIYRKYLGPSVLAGVAVMVLLIPLNAAIAMKTRAFQVEQMQYKDARIKLMSEILNGIKVLKLYAWENSFKEKVLQIRENELKVLRKSAYLGAVSIFAWTSAPFLVALTTFAVYVTVDDKNVLDAKKAFVSLSLFNILRFPLNMLPQVISSIVQASVSLKRIQSFLSHDELDPNSVDKKNIAAGCVVTVVNGKFSWAKSDPATLHRWGSVAYVSQQAWIQNATLRDNILFGKPYNAEKYSSILEACALLTDLEVLPGGDQTEIGEKTRILVTHSITFLPQVDNIVVLVDGSVSEMGSYQELLTQNGAFAEFLRNYALEDIVEEDEAIELEEEEEDFREDTLSNHIDMVDNEPVANEARKQFIRQISVISVDLENPKKMSTRKRKCSERKAAEHPPDKKSSAQKLIYAETTETGRVKLQVFWEYMKAVGPILCLFICFLYCCQNAAAIGANVWLSEWTSDTAVNGTQTETSMRVGVYAALGLTQGVLVMISSFTLALGGIGAARTLHSALLENKFCTPQAFFDTTPLGRIINRFSKDIYVIDEVIPPTILMFLSTFFGSIATITVIIASTPLFAVVIVPLAIAYFFVQRFYVATSRQLKRLESVSRSPIYSHFSETITGTSVIRAYGRQNAFVLISDKKVDENQKSYYPGIVSNRWLGIRIEFIGNCIVLFAALFAVIGRNKLTPGMVGLSVSYALQAPWIVPDKRPPEDWPTQGKVEFNDYSVRYREGLDLVLKNLTLQVKGGEKIGIVGRTGAGKSSMTLCLFRILEAAAGEITIDGVKISEIGLHDLRSKLTIIPQDPVLFSGTLRMNLDPFEKYADEDIWKVLELSHLNRFVSSQPAGINHECSEGGENLSVGQRQLVCLARALLRKTRILVLDEATAAIDLETDDLIQSTIRTQFEDCTVFTIAHRLNTILDYTREIYKEKHKVRVMSQITHNYRSGISVKRLIYVNKVLRKVSLIVQDMPFHEVWVCVDRKAALAAQPVQNDIHYTIRDTLQHNLELTLMKIVLGSRFTMEDICKT